MKVEEAIQILKNHKKCNLDGDIFCFRPTDKEVYEAISLAIDNLELINFNTKKAPEEVPWDIQTR